MSGPAYRHSPIPGVVVAVAGYPDDGRAYVDISPGMRVKGRRVVWWFERAHHYGHIVSEYPIAGEHVDPTWSIERRARYWLEVVPDEDMEAYLDGHERDALLLVATDRAWIVPRDVPEPRLGGT